MILKKIGGKGCLGPPGPRLDLLVQIGANLWVSDNVGNLQRNRIVFFWSLSLSHSLSLSRSLSLFSFFLWKNTRDRQVGKQMYMNTNRRKPLEMHFSQKIQMT